MARRGKRTAPEMVDRLVAIGVSVLCKEQLGLDEAKASELMQEISNQFCAEFGGQPVYVPKGDNLKRARRDREIWAAFNGSNHELLAEQHDLTVVQVYTIVRKQRADFMRRTQPSFPGFEVEQP